MVAPAGHLPTAATPRVGARAIGKGTERREDHSRDISKKLQFTIFSNIRLDDEKQYRNTPAQKTPLGQLQVEG